MLQVVQALDETRLPLSRARVPTKQEHRLRESFLYDSRSAVNETNTGSFDLAFKHWILQKIMPKTVYRSR